MSYTISYLYLYVGLLPSRDPHTLVNGRQVLYVVYKYFFCSFSSVLLCCLGIIFIRIVCVCIWCRENLWKLFRYGWVGSIHLGTILTRSFLLHRIRWAWVFAKRLISPLFFFIKSPLTNSYMLWLRVLYFQWKFVTMATPFVHIFVFNTSNICLLTGRLFLL